MIPGLHRLFGFSLVLLLGLPFAAFAVFTTSLALATLILRVITVYADLVITLAQSALYPTPEDPSPGRILSESPTHASARARRRRSIVSPATPTKNHSLRKAPSFASLIGSGTDRDFEGVGGWRIQRDDDEEAIWININRNLELPASPAATRSHRRSFTGGSLRGSPEKGRSPLLMRSKTHGSVSPEGYFSVPIGSSDAQGQVASKSSNSSATSLVSKSGVPAISVKTSGLESDR